MLLWAIGIYYSSNSTTALCQFPGLVWAGYYKAKMKKHYFPNDLLMCQYLILPLCGPLPGWFSHQPVCSLTPPRNVNSCETSHNTIYYSLVVKWTTSTPEPLQVNGALNGSCDMLQHELNCLPSQIILELQHTNSLHTNVSEIYEDIGW